MIDETTMQSGIDTVARRWQVLGPLLREKLDHLCIATLRGAPSLTQRLNDASLDSYGLDCPSNLHAMKAVRRIRKLHRQRGFDVVQGEETIPALVSCLAFTRPSRPLVVYHRYHEEGRTLHRVVSKETARRSGRVMVATTAVERRAIEQDRVPPQKVCVVGEGVDDMGSQGTGEELDRLRRSWGIAPDVSVVLVVARLRPEKGIDLLLEGARAWPRSAGMPVIVVAGEGPERNHLQQMAAGLDLEVKFVGHQSDLAPWYRLASLVVMPSRKEAFGMVAAEAMSAGRPVVATAVGGLPEVVQHGIEGVLVPPDDPAALILAISDLLQDPARLCEMGNAGRKRYEREYQPARVIDRWTRCWSESV